MVAASPGALSEDRPTRICVFRRSDISGALTVLHRQRDTEYQNLFRIVDSRGHSGILRTILQFREQPAQRQRRSTQAEISYFGNTPRRVHSLVGPGRTIFMDGEYPTQYDLFRKVIQ